MTTAEEAITWIILLALLAGAMTGPVRGTPRVFTTAPADVDQVFAQRYTQGAHRNGYTYLAGGTFLAVAAYALGRTAGLL